MDVGEKLALVVCTATQKTNYKCEFNCEKKGECAYCLVMAEQMIAHGVTVQEWISVKDRLPSKKKVIDGETYFKNVAVRVKDLEFEKIAFYDDEEKCWFDTEFFPIAGEVTHWCDLPQPPKGE